MTNIPFYLFNFIHVLLAILFSAFSCTLIIEMSRYTRKKKLKKNFVILNSQILALSFLLTHLFISSTSGIPFSGKDLFIYLPVVFLMYAIGSYLAIKLSYKTIHTQLEYFFTGIGMGLLIIGGDAIGFLLLFKDYIEIKPILLIISALLTIGTSYSVMRFLNQLTNEDIYKIVVKWRAIGGILAGCSLAGIPYITLVSIINFDKLFSPPADSLSFLVPFIFVINANLFMMLGPDFFGEMKFLKSIRRYQALFRNNPNAIFSLDLKGKIINVNSMAQTLTGYSREELTQKPLDALFNAKTLDELQLLEESSGTIMKLETALLHKDGHPVEAMLTAVPIFINKLLVGKYILAEDLSDKKAFENMIKHQAFYDDLTDLPNRRAFSEAMAASSKRGSFALLLIDFDKFKRVNDNFGHRFGDKVLIEISRKLGKHNNEETLALSRLSGDEFALIVPTNTFFRKANAIVNEFKGHLIVENQELTMTPSIGISLFPDHSSIIDNVLMYADIAMYEAKKTEQNIKLFNPGMLEKELERYQLEMDLRKAILNDELMVYYQPKFNSLSDECIGAEALLRWNHPVHGFISPGKFIPIAEETKIIVNLEMFVVDKVIRDLSRWKEEGRGLKRVSVNISKTTLFQERFIDFVKNTMARDGLSGEYLEFEITERLMMENEEQLNVTLKKLRDWGIEVSIDDFGTGYSSLSYLHKLQVDRLKIDQSFVQQSGQTREVLAAIISLANNLNLKLIAEGVETRSQLETLQEFGCFEVQGFYYSPAIHEDDFKKFLQAGISQNPDKVEKAVL